METATIKHDKTKFPEGDRSADGTQSASQLYKQYLGKWQQTYGTAPYTPSGTTEKKYPMTMAQWLVVAKKQGIISADGTVHNAGGTTPGQPDGTTAKKHHADAAAAKKKSKLLLYGGVAVGVLALGLVIRHFAKKHHKAA